MDTNPHGDSLDTPLVLSEGPKASWTEGTFDPDLGQNQTTPENAKQGEPCSRSQSRFPAKQSPDIGPWRADVLSCHV